MKIEKTTQLAHALAALTVSAGLLASAPAYSQAFPSKPVTVIVSQPPGGLADMVARLISDRLAKKWNQTVVVQNKPGAGGVLGLMDLLRATPDGYTLGITTTAVVQAPILSKAITYKLEDFAPVSLISKGPFVMAISPNVPARNLADFMAYAKANPGKLNYATTGLGPVRFVGEGFMASSKVKLTEIPYRGSAEMTMALLAGDAHVTFDSTLNIKRHADVGKLVPLAIADSQRMPLLPNVPTAAEAGLPNFNFSFWNGLLAPAGTPAAIVNKISADVNEILKDPEVMSTILNRSGASATGMSPAAFKQFIDAEYKANVDLARSLGLSPQ